MRWPFRRLRKEEPNCILIAINQGSSFYTQRHLFEGYTALGDVRCVEPGHEIFEGKLLEGPKAGTVVYIYDCEVEPMTRQQQVTCRCDVYPFPHRAYSGNCVGFEIEDFAMHSGCCADCSHWREEYQSHPYGETSATEDISYCNLMMESTADFLTECPALDTRRKK